VGRSVLLLAGAPMVLVACSGARDSRVVSTSQPIVAVAPGAELTIGYFSRAETAATRGPCGKGYMKVDVSTIAAPHAGPACVYDSYSSPSIRVQPGIGYPFSLGNLHCGLSVVQFDGNLYIPDDLGQAWSVDAGTQPIGTMTLLASGHARFVGQAGFVDTLHAVSFLRLPGCA
jgi:hypothetical protein